MLNECFSLESFSAERIVDNDPVSTFRSKLFDSMQ
jgi:hypothetical protein